MTTNDAEARAEELTQQNRTLMKLVNRYKSQITDLDIQIVKHEVTIETLQIVIGELRGKIEAMEREAAPEASPPPKPNGKGKAGSQPAVN